MFDKEGCGISNNRRRYSCDEACCRKNVRIFFFSASLAEIFISHRIIVPLQKILKRQDMPDDIIPFFGEVEDKMQGIIKVITLPRELVLATGQLPE